MYWGLEGTLLDQGFDFAYDKRLLDCLRSPDAGACVRHLLSAMDPRHGPRLARFLENHDEPRSAVTLGARLTAGAALVATLPGMRFFFDGQFEGRRVKPPVQLATLARRTGRRGRARDCTTVCCGSRRQSPARR